MASHGRCECAIAESTSSKIEIADHTCAHHLGPSVLGCSRLRELLYIQCLAYSLREGHPSRAMTWRRLTPCAPHGQGDLEVLPCKPQEVCCQQDNNNNSKQRSSFTRKIQGSVWRGPTQSESQSQSQQLAGRSVPISPHR